MLVLFLLNLSFYSTHCNNGSILREDTEMKVIIDLEPDLMLQKNKREIESCGKRKGIMIRNNLEACVGF